MTYAHENPFRTERLDAIAFRPHDPGLTLDDVVIRVRDAGWHGAVVGPHGSGKSTLLRALADAAEAAGRAPLRVFTNQSMPRAERARRLDAAVDLLPGTPQAVLCLDGWCHFSPWQRRRVRRAAARAGAGVLGLAHLCGWGLPVLYRTRTTPRLLSELVAELDPAAGDTPEAERELKTARGNLREALLRRYDLRAGTGTEEPEA